MPRVSDYTGTPALGLGSTSGIPVSTTKDLDPVNQAGRDATLLNVEQQRQLFNRKLKDRDELLKLLQSGDLKVGDHLERDMPVLKKAFDELDNAFAERARKGFNDIDATVAYNKSLRKANDTITQAQGRFLIDKQVKQDVATNELPSERGNILKEHEGYLGKFWSDYTPHVKPFTLDHPGLTAELLKNSTVANSGVTTPPQQTTKRTVTDKNGKITTQEVVTDAPVKGQKPVVGTDGKLSMFTTVPGKYVDYNKIAANAADLFHDEKQRLNQTEFMDFVLNKTSPVQLKRIVDQANARIKTYNEQRGFLTPDFEGYVDPIEIVEGPDGSRNTPESVSDFNAKMALAGLTGDYVEQDKQAFDKDMAKVIGDEKELAEKIRHNKATEGNDWLKYNLDKDKWTDTVKGAEESKNASMVFAENILNDMIGLGHPLNNGGYFLSPDQIRKLTGEQLKYLGRELPASEDALGVKTPAGLQPLKLNDDDAIQINPDGTIRVLSGATFDDKNKQWKGRWDKERSTSVFNIARNGLNEENQKSGSKERNSYVPIDIRERGKVSVDVSGGSTTKSGTTVNKDNLSTQEKDWKQEGNNWRYKDGTLYDANGKVVKEK